MRTLRSLADLEELRKLLPDGPEDSVTVLPTQLPPAPKPATVPKPVTASPRLVASPPVTAVKPQPHVPSTVTQEARREGATRRRRSPAAQLGGGKLLVTSKGKGDFTFEKTRQATLEVLERIYGRNDLWCEKDGELHLYVPSEDIGSWIGSGGLVAGNLKKIFGVAHVRVHDIAKLAA